jgi:hypothetical protein
MATLISLLTSSGVDNTSTVVMNGVTKECSFASYVLELQNSLNTVRPLRSKAAMFC